MKRPDKEQLVATALYYTDFTGLNVKRMTELRRRFRRAGVKYVVIKNTLALRAINESGLAAVTLKGPTGVVVATDGIAAAKLLSEFQKENEQRPTVKGGLYEGAPVDEALMTRLASLPTRTEAYSLLLGAFSSVLAMFALTLEARKTQLEAGTPTA